MTVVLAMSGCSLGIAKLPDRWDGSAEPECSDSIGLVVLDAIVGGLSLGVLAAAVNREDTPLVVVSGTGTLTFGIASLIGENRVRECKEAKAAWRIGGAIGHASKRDETSVEQLARDERIDRAKRERLQREAAVVRTPPPVPPPSQPPPRGHFCATSAGTPNAGLCAREKSDCQRARDAVLAAVADMTECALVETAWCFDAGPGDERCVPTTEGCAAARARHETTVAPAPVNDCREAQ